MHWNPYALLGGDLQGTLPNPSIRGESAGLQIASRVFAPRVTTSSSSSSSSSSTPDDASAVIAGRLFAPRTLASKSYTVATDTIWDVKGDLAVGTGADMASRLAAGSNGTVLTADSTQTTGLRWSASSGIGALVFLEGHTASSSATLDFTAMSSTYEEYVFEFVNILPATAGAAIWFRMSTDGGATYDSGANYGATWFVGVPLGFGNGGTFSGLSAIIATTVDSTASHGGMSGQFRLYAASSAIWATLIGQYATVGGGAADNRIFNCHLSGYYEQTAALVNGFRFLFSTGNITSGTIRMYGVAKS